MKIFTEISAFFAAPYLAEILDCPLYTMDISYNDFFGNDCILGEYCGDKTERIDNGNIIIIGIKALKRISNRIINMDFDRIILILCDTNACLEYKWWNDFVIKYKIELYIMPDIKEYCFIDYKPIYQYIKVNTNLIEKKQKSKLLISHSPRSKSKLIINIINKLKKIYDFDFELISGLNMIDALKRKSRSHIFVDQLIYKNKDINQQKFGGEIIYNGGMGKSGIEGMLLNCAVITGGIKPFTDPHFNTPPITWASADSFYNDLENLIINEEYRKRQIINQNNWLNKYMNKEFYKKYLNV